MSNIIKFPTPISEPVNEHRNLSDEDLEILQIIGPAGLQLKYDGLKQERERLNYMFQALIKATQ